MGNAGHANSAHGDNKNKSSDIGDSNSRPVEISLLSDDEEEGEMRLYEQIAF